MAKNKQQDENTSGLFADEHSIRGLKMTKADYKGGGVVALLEGTVNFETGMATTPEMWVRALAVTCYHLLGRNYSYAVRTMEEAILDEIDEIEARRPKPVQSADELTGDWLGKKLGSVEIRSLVSVADVGDCVFTDGVNAPNKADGASVDLPSADAYRAAAELKADILEKTAIYAVVEPIKLGVGSYLRVSIPCGSELDNSEFQGYDVLYTDLVSTTSVVNSALGVLDEHGKDALSPEAQQAIDGLVASYGAAFGVNDAVKQDIRDGLDSGEPTSWNPEEIKQEGRRIRKTKSTVVSLHGDDQSGTAA